MRLPPTSTSTRMVFAPASMAFSNSSFTTDAESDAAMRRRAVGQRVEEKAEAAAQLFFTKAERFEQALLNVLAVDSDAAGAELVAVQNEVVAFGAHFPRRGFEFIQVFVDNAGEGMLRADPGFVGFTPLEQRKAGEPQEFPLRFVDRAERLAKMQAQLAR